MQHPAAAAHRLTTRADRIDELAETAALMGDDATSARLHAEAIRCRELAMSHLDDADRA